MAAEKHGFKAEVQKLLDLMIHSVYSNRDVFLRELISNAADALDKVRFLELTESELAPLEGETAGIRISVDKDAGTIVLEDDGIGMTRDEAMENLGTIARSGSKAFFERLKDAEDKPHLIGQFGVGFYSAFMVAERVEVETRSARADATAVRWTSTGDGTYTVEDTLRAARGTRITLFLREDAMEEYGSEWRIQDIVRSHSNFLSWPIFMGGEQVNSGKALWTQRPSEVSDEDANDFYKSLTHEFSEPALRVHVQVDTPFQYSAMLFVPSNRPFDLFQPDATRGPRLYARRVLIEENAKELVPEWLRFLRGVVDSEDISLNMSREMIQQTPVVRKIRDALTKRVLRELGKMAKKDAPEDGDHPYHQVWKNFGVVLKEGYYHDRDAYGDRLLPLMRFESTDGEPGELTSFADYLAAMPEGQDTIWILAASSRQAALANPALEGFKKRGWNVLLLTDPVDEWLIPHLESFDDTPIKSIDRGDLDLDDEEEGEKADLETFGPWLKDLYGDRIGEVRGSSRLTESPAVLVDAEGGVSSNMERILRAANQDGFTATQDLELNLRHPLVRNLATLHGAGDTQTASGLAGLLLDEARLLHGDIQDPAAIAHRIQAMLTQQAAEAVARLDPTS